MSTQGNTSGHSTGLSNPLRQALRGFLYAEHEQKPTLSTPKHFEGHDVFARLKPNASDPRARELNLLMAHVKQ